MSRKGSLLTLGLTFKFYRIVYSEYKLFAKQRKLKNRKQSRNLSAPDARGNSSLFSLKFAAFLPFEILSRWLSRARHMIGAENLQGAAFQFQLGSAPTTDHMTDMVGVGRVGKVPDRPNKNFWEVKWSGGRVGGRWSVFGRSVVGFWSV